jgi:hypothetical protein
VEIRVVSPGVAAPVPPIERVPPDQVQRSPDRLPIVLGHDQQHVVGHALPQKVEEVAGQVRSAPPGGADISVFLREGSISDDFEKRD